MSPSLPAHPPHVRRAIPPGLWPAIVWVGGFLVTPLLIIFVYSFLKKGTYGGVTLEFTFGNYIRALDFVYLDILWESFQLALLTALGCLALGYPIAYVMATSRPAARHLLMVLIVIPFWTNLVVRTYAIKLLLSDHGPLNEFLLSLGWIAEPLPLGNSYAAVVFGMITNYLPFMVLPLYVSLEKFDFSLLEAARDLGSSGFNTIRRVLIPLTQRGIATGFLLVFTPALGEFLIPDLLGGAQTMLVGNLIVDQFLKMRDWPFGSAISVLLMGLVGLSLLIAKRCLGDDDARRKV